MKSASKMIRKQILISPEQAQKIRYLAKRHKISFSQVIRKAIDGFDPYEMFTESEPLKTLKIEIPPSVLSVQVESDDIIADLEKDRASRVFAYNVTSAKIYYEASVKNPGYLDRVNTVTVERTSGSFQNGEFKSL